MRDLGLCPNDLQVSANGDSCLDRREAGDSPTDATGSVELVSAFHLGKSCMAFRHLQALSSEDNRPGLHLQGNLSGLPYLALRTSGIPSRVPYKPRGIIMGVFSSFLRPMRLV